MTLRKGQKLINYLRKKYHSLNLEEQDSLIRMEIFYMSNTEFDNIINTPDEKL